MNVGIGHDPVMSWHQRRAAEAEAKAKALEAQLATAKAEVERYRRALHYAHRRIALLSALRALRPARRKAA